MQLRDIMTRDVELVSPDTPLQEAARRMRDIDTGFLPIGADDRLVGTVTDRDITIRCTAEGADPKQAKVRDAMSEELIYCFDDQDVREAAALMAQKQIRRLPVLNRDKRLVGVVSLGDVATGSDDRQATAQAAEGVSRQN